MQSRHAKELSSTGVTFLKSKTKKAAAKKPAAKKSISKTSTRKKPAAKTVAPKPMAKKPIAKRPVVKKPAAKKQAARKPAPKKIKKAKQPAPKAQASELMTRILASLDDDKAEQVVTIDLAGRSSLADAVVIASGRSSRHVAAIADHLARRLKEGGYGTRPIFGAATGDWVLVDAGDVIVHVFRPEVRDYYDLEGMWKVGTSGRGA